MHNRKLCPWHVARTVQEGSVGGGGQGEQVGGLSSVDAVDRRGSALFPAEEWVGVQYRTSRFPPDASIVGLKVELSAAPPPGLCWPALPLL